MDKNTTSMCFLIILKGVLYATKWDQNNLLSWNTIEIKQILNLVDIKTNLVIKKNEKDIIWEKLKQKDYDIQ